MEPWNELAARWREDHGALLDGYVTDTTADDWQTMADALRRRDWPESYAEDGHEAIMPAEISACFARAKEAACLWQVRPLDDLRVNFHFWDPGEIEFDLDPREIHDQRHFEAVRDFLVAVGRALQQPVEVCIEGGPPRCPTDLRYDPEADAVTVPSRDA